MCDVVPTASKDGLVRRQREGGSHGRGQGGALQRQSRGLMHPEIIDDF